MSKYRKQLVHTYSMFYRRHFTSDAYVCFYCNEPGNTIDHAPCITHITRFSIVEWHKLGIPLSLILSCEACNAHLACKPLYTIQSRLESLLQKYTKRLTHKLPNWSSKELAELSPELQAQVRIKLEQRNVTLHQIAAISARLLNEASWPRLDNDDN